MAGGGSLWVHRLLWFVWGLFFVRLLLPAVAYGSPRRLAISSSMSCISFDTIEWASLCVSVRTVGSINSSLRINCMSFAPIFVCFPGSKCNCIPTIFAFNVSRVRIFWVVSGGSNDRGGGSSSALCQSSGGCGGVAAVERRIVRMSEMS